MKPLGRIRSHFGEHADLYRMAAAALAAGILVVLFVLTQPVDLRRHNILLSHFSHLQSDDARLGEAVLELNFNVSNNYDQVTAIIGHMRGTVRELREGEAADDLRQDAEFQQQLLALEQRLSAQQDALEKFKSRNAVLKNSLLYLPRASDDLLADLPRGTVAHEYVGDLIQQILLNRIAGALLERGDLDTIIVALQKETANLPASTRQKLDGLVRHIRQIDQYERDMPGLVRQLTSHTEYAGLADAYRHHYDDRQRRAAAYRLFLLLVTLALLSYGIRAFIRLREQSSRLKLAARVFGTASEGVTITDIDGTILDVNTAFTVVTGYTREEVLGKNPRLLQSGRHSAQFYAKMWQSIRETGQWQGEVWNRRKNGEVYPEWLNITAGTVDDGEQKKVTHYVATFSDITLRKQNEAEIFQLAFYDPLTELPNRRLLMDRLRHIMASRGYGVGHAALLFIDIDNFKTLNDIKGHDIGDLLLIDIARRLRSCVREGDTVSRLGGDEFVVMLESLSPEPEQAAAQAKAAGDKIHQSLNQPYQLKDFEHHSTCSIGISMFNHDVSADELLKHADTAMYEAKAAGRNALRFFDPAMQSALEARATLETELRQALAEQQFSLYYQIQVDADRHPIGVEALVRWNHPQRGLVLPEAFIPLAEETGLIQPIGQWVLETACAQLKAWEADASTRDLVLAINVSPRQFGAQGFVNKVESTLLRSGIAAARLKLEITESMLLHNVENVISTMRQLKALGVSFSMDDFGTGYSSLQYLKRLPLDQIKIDQSFVRDITIDRSDQEIVRTIIAMAQSMNLSIIAEGVETEQQRQLIANRGCTNYQGFLFGRPVPIEEFETLLRQK
jgi:diguanylate cyclase (GGDEF)-like protein/PAS domain S-box-containing protein